PASPACAPAAAAARRREAPVLSRRSKNQDSKPEFPHLESPSLESSQTPLQAPESSRSDRRGCAKTAPPAPAPEDRRSAAAPGSRRTYPPAHRESEPRQTPPVLTLPLWQDPLP